MKRIFEEAIINNGLAGNIVLFYGDYIIGDLPKEKTEIVIDQINRGQFNLLEFDSSIDVKSIVKYEFEPGNDSSIVFAINKNDVSFEKKIDFQNVEVVKRAEKSINAQFLQLGFKRKEIQLTPKEAAIPAVKNALGIAIIGFLLTGYVYTYNGNQPSYQRIKWHVRLFQKLAESVGYLPFLIITIVLVLLCLVWAVKRMANPPFKISSAK